MFTSILNIYNPKDQRSLGILKLFAEDLSDSERINFVESIFEQGSWILPTEISRASNSLDLKKLSNLKFHQILDRWVNKRIEHSSNIQIGSKYPFITHELISEFRQLLLSLKNLDFSSDLLTIFDNLFENSNPSYLKKFLHDSISVVIEEYSESELEIFFIYFSNKYIEKRSINYANFVYIFLNQLAFSYKIHDLFESFLRYLKDLSTLIDDSDRNSNIDLLISVFLIDFIIDKKLDLSNSHYDVKILRAINNLEKGDYNNLVFYKFLKQFNYSFVNLNFSLEVEILLRKFNENIQNLNNTTDHHKKDTLIHYMRSSSQFFEYFLLFLEHCVEEMTVEYFTNFINLIDELRSLFFDLLWFEEFLNFKIINGNIKTKITNGFEVKIDDKIFNDKIIEKNLQDKISPEFILKSGYGFLKQANINEFLNEGDVNSFYISTLNYSVFNKGKIITLVPSNNYLDSLISNFQVKALFSSVELYLIEKAFKFLDLDSPFSKKTISLKQLIPSVHIEGFNLNSSADSFSKMLKTVRPFLYNSIYVKHANKLESFKKIINAYENNQTITGHIKFKKNGGMSVDVFGIEAFLPGSQISIKSISDYDVYVNHGMDFKILKIDLQTKNIVVSHKAVIERENDIARAKFIAGLRKGQIVEGVIKNITSYGAFVDLGFVDGLIHIKDIAWSRINHPNDVVTLDQKVQVLILDFDENTSKIELGLKQINDERLSTFNEVKKGDKFKCKIIAINGHGIVVKFKGENETLIHISELCWSKTPLKYSDRYNFIKKIFSLGDDLDAVVIKRDMEDHKIILSIKELIVDPWTTVKIGNELIGKVKFINYLGIHIVLENGLQGFINISEFGKLKISYKKHEMENYIKKMFPFNKNIEVVVIEKDSTRKILSLRLKQSGIGQWPKLIKSIKKNDVVKAKVTKIVQFGAFLKLENGLEGLLFISNLCHEKIPLIADDRYNFIKNIVSIGDFVDVLVLNINLSKCQISFGLKQVQQNR